MKTIYEFLLKNKTAASTQDNDYVDLGLPSGLLWARCNIGAEKPTDYGDYFMWGSTKSNSYDNCAWSNTPFNDGKDSYNKRYFKSIRNKVCPHDILSPKYDAAAVILDNDWRLPTEDDFKELIDNTKHEWVNNYQDSSISGRIFTAKNAKANGAELFIPASGRRNGSVYEVQGRIANLWSSSLSTDWPDCAMIFKLYDSSCGIYNYYRFAGFCLRSVKET